jgi:acyl carrier protein
MTETTVARTPRTAEDIESWLTDRVAFYLERPAGEIDPDLSMADYGLDSVLAFSLCGEIEDFLDVDAEPTLLWDFDTIRGLTAHLLALTA